MDTDSLSAAERFCAAIREAAYEIRGSVARQGGKRPDPDSFWAGALDALGILKPAWQRAGTDANRDVTEGASDAERERARAERFAAVLPVLVDQTEQSADASSRPAAYRHGVRWVVGHLRYVMHAESRPMAD